MPTMVFKNIWNVFQFSNGSRAVVSLTWRSPLPRAQAVVYLTAAYPPLPTTLCILCADSNSALLNFAAVDVYTLYSMQI
jgi:hypothetical protein